MSAGLRSTASVLEFDIYGCRVRIETDSPVCRERLGKLYESFRPPDSASESRFSLRRGARGWRVVSPTLSRRLPSLAAALNLLEYEICGLLLRGRREWIALHAGVVVAPNGAVLITGESGAGKTTLTLALSTHGYAALADDIAFLDPAGGPLRPLPRCFHLDDGSLRLLDGVGFDAPKRAARYGFITPNDLAPGVAALPPVRLIVHLIRGQGPASRLEPITQAEAALELFRQSGQSNHPPAEALPALSRVAGGARCYRLHRGTLASCVSAIASVSDSETSPRTSH